MKLPYPKIAAPASWAAASDSYLVPSSEINSSEKSRPPVIAPISGVMISLTKEFIMLVKADPITIPVAKSTIFPFIANALNSLIKPFEPSFTFSTLMSFFTSFNFPMANASFNCLQRK